jgi:hypothetical protein
MSASTSADASNRRWLPANEMRAIGFSPGGPEIDYGMRWGPRRDIRVSFAPCGDDERGFLYAHDPRSDRYQLLAAHTTRDRVDAAWRELMACTESPEDYLALAALDEAPLSVGEAGALLLHCLDREMAAYRDYLTAGSDAQTRFDAAQAVVVQRSARVAAEQLQIAAARAGSAESEPVVVRYRVLDEAGAAGRVAGASLESAVVELGRVAEVAGRHQLELRATSVTHGHATMSAARVPELAGVASWAPINATAPRLGL